MLPANDRSGSSLPVSEFVRPGWTIALQVKEVGSGASQRQLREKLLDAERRRITIGDTLGCTDLVRPETEPFHHRIIR